MDLLSILGLLLIATATPGATQTTTAPGQESTQGPYTSVFCPPGAEWTACVGCGATCETLYMSCTGECHEGCRCTGPGYVLYQGSCIPSSNCPETWQPSSEAPSTEMWQPSSEAPTTEVPVFLNTSAIMGTEEVTTPEPNSPVPTTAPWQETSPEPNSPVLTTAPGQEASPNYIPATSATTWTSPTGPWSPGSPSTSPPPWTSPTWTSPTSSPPSTSATTWTSPTGPWSPGSPSTSPPPWTSPTWTSPTSSPP
ncbi:hypothetical protein XENTR_v10019626, partial [Xenopus tropicalis]